MNTDDENNNEFSSISLNKLIQNKITRDPIFYILLINTIIAIISLILLLNQNNSLSRIFFKFTQISLLKIKIYHILFLIIIGVYSYYYFSLKELLEQIDIDNFKFISERLIKFNRAYEIESKIWFVFIIIICLLTMYRHAYLINKEEKLRK